jgi:hypothetical protein
MKSDLLHTLQHYFTLYRELQEKGGPEEDGELFEKALTLQEEILAQFGLPPADRYRQIFWKFTEAGELTDKLLVQTEGKLKKAAEKHLSKPAQTDLEVLTKAKKKKLDPFDVLPELGHPTHDYTFYLYRVLLLQGLATPEEVLDELNRIKALQIYREVAELKFGDTQDATHSPVFKKYKEELRYLEAYLAYVEEEDDEN